MLRELQELVDDVAECLDAPTVLLDRELRTVAHSAHGERVDAVRRDSILNRRAAPDTLGCLRAIGIFHSTEPVRIPGNADRGILGRLCLPVRYRGRLLAFFWMLDDAARIDEELLAEVRPTVRRVAELLYDEEATHSVADRLLSRLLSTWEDRRALAAREIVDRGLVPAEAAVHVVVVRPLGPSAEQARELAGQALWDLVADPAHGAPDTLRFVRDDHAVLLVPAPTPDDDEAARAVATRGRQALVARLARRAGSRNGAASQWRAVAGIGEPQRRLARAVASYRQARLAARVAALVPSVGDVAHWRCLGAYRVLAHLPGGEAVEQSLDPRLRVLFDSGGPEAVETLETYLDLAGDAKATAERLYLHRATLYYRLGRIERLTGIDLRDGHDRLAIHLSLKLSRLLGLRPAT
jgi:PucR C-terminal helix-turn-helix domain/GGDEF-like domain